MKDTQRQAESRTPSTARIAIIHRDPAVVQTLTACLRAAGHAVCSAEGAGDAALALVELDREGAGIEAAARVPGVPVLYLVGDVDEDVLARARATAPAGYLAQPIDERQVQVNIGAALAVQGRLAGLQSRNELLQSVFDNLSEGVAVADADGRFVMTNRVAVEMMQLEAGVAEDPNRWAETRDHLEPDERTPFQGETTPVERVLAGESVDGDRTFIKPNGAEGIHINVWGRPLRDADGRVRGAVMGFSDVTRQREAEIEQAKTLEESRRQTELLEQVFNGITDSVAVFDAAGRYLMLNASGRRMARIGPEGDLGPLTEALDFRHADDMRPCPPEEMPVARVLRGEVFDDARLCVVAAPEATVYFTASGRPLTNRDGSLRGGITIFRDVSAERERRRRLERALDDAREQKATLDAVLESVADGVVAVDANGRVVTVNSSATRILGVAPDELGKWSSYGGLVLADGVTRVPPEEHPLARALRGEAVDNMRVFVRHPRLPDGVHLGISARPMPDPAGTPVGAVAVFRDVTAMVETERARQQALDDLQEQNRLLDMVFDGISDGVVFADAGGKLTIFNASAQRIVGLGITDAPPDEWSATYGTFFPDTVTPYPSERLPLVRALHGDPSDDVELFIRNPRVPDGVHVSVSGRPMRDTASEMVGGVVVFRDVTQRVRTQQALAEAFAHGRLEVVETILHNIGNAINSVAVGVETVRERFRRNRLFNRFDALAQAIAEHEDDWIPWLETDPQGRKVRAFILSLAGDFARQNEATLRTVDRVADRVRHIVDIIQTQESATNGTVERKQVRLRQAIVDAVRLQQESLTKRGIEIDIDCRRAPAEIRIQESRFHQMLVNLIKNAVEAIDELTKRDGLEQKPLIRIAAYTQDELLVLDVTDNGIGIGEEAQRSIFNAGYTTKKDGSGLGLHSAANFANDCGGGISVLSDGAGRGATMRVTLALLPPPAALPDHDQGTA